FQTLALTVLVLTAWIAGWEVVGRLASDRQLWGLAAADWALVGSPWRAVLSATRPATSAGLLWPGGI
ncbi:MAG: hypothetical protein GTO03_10225, partial [Planctomycetales bacterium]|nr:hypothetical protein [Planctomycetales bacterium]